ncbi:MAG: hypothetical protein HC844_05120 [Tabrizicola sp.]|nr:hypothetical protein [Tabrizicola sp.]
MRGAAPAFLLALCIAAPAQAEGGPTDAQRAAFIAAITANDCKMTEAEAEVQLPAVGVDRDTSAQITEALISAGLAELDEDKSVLTLKTEGCPE